MEKGTIGKRNIAKIESFDLPSIDTKPRTFLLSSEMEKLFLGTTTEDYNQTFKPQQPDTEYYSGDYGGDYSGDYRGR